MYKTNSPTLKSVGFNCPIATFYPISAGLKRVSLISNLSRPLGICALFVGYLLPFVGYFNIYLISSIARYPSQSFPGFSFALLTGFPGHVAFSCPRLEFRLLILCACRRHFKSAFQFYSKSFSQILPFVGYLLPFIGNLQPILLEILNRVNEFPSLVDHLPHIDMHVLGYAFVR